MITAACAEVDGPVISLRAGPFASASSVASCDLIVTTGASSYSGHGCEASNLIVPQIVKSLAAMLQPWTLDVHAKAAGGGFQALLMSVYEETSKVVVGRHLLDRGYLTPVRHTNNQGEGRRTDAQHRLSAPG